MTASTDRISIQLPELRVLIVEDDPVMRLGLGRLLGAYPQLKMVGEAEDGYSGVEAALALKPNLIVMDIGLPELDGIAATQQIKSSLPAVRVMMLTSHSSEQEIIASLSSGADGFCVKGLGLEKLVVAIAYFTPCRSANFDSKAATLGPWVSHPVDSGSCKACHSSSPVEGSEMGILRRSVIRLLLHGDVAE